MSNVSVKKVFVQIESAAEQQEHIKNQRKTFKVLQGVATDKENKIGKLSRLKAATDITLTPTEQAKRKKVETRAAETQTSPEKQQTVNAAATVTVADLTNEGNPSEKYWQRLSEKRREALEETLIENQCLHERINGLEEELNTSRQMLEEARNLVDVLTEMLNENEAEREIENEGVEPLASKSVEGDQVDDSDSETRSSAPTALETVKNEDSPAV